MIYNSNTEMIQAEQENVIERTVNLNNMGEATIIFTNNELKKRKLVNGYGGSTVRIVSTVTEDLTGIKRNATAEVIIVLPKMNHLLYL